tara:strand:- start:449 stop:748 length:300 start_codon:yes stop_codon:yes gene_type:complete
LNSDTRKSTKIDFLDKNKKTLWPGFEPGYPKGNKLSRLAQYQIVPPQHSFYFLYPEGNKLACLEKSRFQACAIFSNGEIRNLRFPFPDYAIWAFNTLTK